MSPATPQAEQRVRIAARAIGRHQLAHAYGHCSERLDAQHFLVCAPKPMGLIAPGDTGTVVSVNGPLPAGVLGEVRLHQCIYRERPDVGAVVRSMPASLMAMSAARRVPRPLHGPGSYFGAQGAALWDDPQLIRDDTRAQAVTDTLGERAAVVMRGNGVVVVGASLLEAVVRTWYLEDAARLELSLLAASLGDQAAVMSVEESAQRATTQGGILERMGQFLCAGDPEGSLG